MCRSSLLKHPDDPEGPESFECRSRPQADGSQNCASGYEHYAINDFYDEYHKKIELIDYKKYFKMKQIEDRSAVNTGRIFLHIVIVKEIQFLLDEIELFIEFIHYIVKKNRKNMKLKVVGINDRTKNAKPIYMEGYVQTRFKNKKFG